MEIAARHGDVVSILNMVLYGLKSDSGNIRLVILEHKVIYVIYLIITPAQLRIIIPNQRQCYCTIRLDNTYYPDMTNTYLNSYDNEQKEVFLKQIIIFDIGPDEDNQCRTLDCKLGSDWLKFHSIRTELKITRSLSFRDFHTSFNTFLSFIALISKIISNFMTDCLLWGSLDVFLCVRIASPWSTSWGDRYDRRASVKITCFLRMEVTLCCSNMFWGGLRGGHLRVGLSSCYGCSGLFWIYVITT